MTQEHYQKAMKFAGEKHSEQKVPGTDANYLLHISNVAMEVLVAHSAKNEFDLDFAVQVAILHDTIEDTSATYDELKSEFGSAIANAVLALTKDENIATKQDRMNDSLARINRLEKEVGLVKLADRITNLQSPPAHWDIDKIRAYCLEAKLILKELSGKNDYLNKRLDHKISEYEKQIEKR